jgi:predicted ribosome quality control (RQC) complex YloA/Tae2 family protein
VELPDPYGGGTVGIDLDRRRTPAANAERYFQAARRAERAARELAARSHQMDERAQALAAAEAHLDKLSDSDLEAIARLARELAALGVLPREIATEALEISEGKEGEERRGRPGRKLAGPKRRDQRAEAPARLPYRTYLLTEGWEVWVGRTAADNDVLTHELARPHDFWLHARGAGGSHVLLRRSDGSRGVPPRGVIEAAASYAAFFSQARNSRMVPVIVTEKRYVRKPRRSPPGMAVCLREKTVMAAPRRPSETPPRTAG